MRRWIACADVQRSLRNNYSGQEITARLHANANLGPKRQLLSRVHSKGSLASSGGCVSISGSLALYLGLEAL